MALFVWRSNMAVPKATGRRKQRCGMGKLIDLTGQRFGRLVVLERVENHGKDPAWLCKCDCGTVKTVSGNHLRSGNIQSCGCGRRDAAIEHSTKHGGGSSKLYKVWAGMKTRCYNSKFKYYKNYGGRGITVCKEWIGNFGAFQDWALSHGYAEGLTIDRIDNDKGYSPDNCRWVTMKEQRHNRRDCKE